LKVVNSSLKPLKLENGVLKRNGYQNEWD